MTELLRPWGKGDAIAPDRLTPLVFNELHRIARRHTRLEHGGNTLQTTALLHEAHLRLENVQNVGWQDRVHFFAISAQITRRILVDRARARGSAKRRAEVRAASMDLDQVPGLSGRGAELIAVDDALNALAQMDQGTRRRTALRWRFERGGSRRSAISPQGVIRDWRFAKAWLVREITR